MRALDCDDKMATRKSRRRLGSKLLLYRKDHARSKLRPFHVKIIVCRSLNLAVGRLLKKMPWRKSRFGRFRTVR